MKSDKLRIADLEMRLADMQRQLSGLGTRLGNPLSAKNGWWVAKLDEDLLAGETATASLWAWNNGVWADTGNNVEVQDYFLPDGETLDSGTKIEVAWHRNVWTWRRPGEGGEIVRTGILYEDLAQGSFATTDEIELNDAAARAFTGFRYEVYDIKLNDGESIPAGTVIDFVRAPNGYYRWITALCDVSDNTDSITPAPDSTPPESTAEESSYGFGPDPFIPSEEFV